MSDRLHPLLLVLTLLDLGFVTATGAVDATLTLPLWGLAIAAPRLRRLQRLRLYRAAWNGCVLVVFGLLLRHAVTTGLLHLLEDGLVLSVLCQVHLLNNLGERQRPDLVFFNSFLIAFVTSFFAPDVWWSLLFVAHTLAFLPALQLHVLSRRGDCDAATAKAVLRDSAPRTLAVSAATALVFVVWPRDFERQGWMHQHLALDANLRAGIADRVTPERHGPAVLDDTVHLRIRAENEQLLRTVPTHWRARAYDAFDGYAWTARTVGDPLAPRGSDTAWEPAPDGAWRRAARAEVRAWLHVEQHDRSSGALATPLASVALVPRGLAGVVVEPAGQGTFATFAAAGAPRAPLSYDVGVANPRPRAAAKADARFTTLPLDGAPPVAIQLGRRLRSQLPVDVDDLTFARTAADWLSSHRRYALPGAPGFARSLDEFLLGTSAGHCEYFATTLALVLRSEQVPCRLVGGYLVYERERGQDALVARARHAHAWVEVLAADGSWHTFDATPAADVRQQTAANDGAWDAAVAWLEDAWAAVTGFDAAARAAWLDAAWQWPLRHPVQAALLAALLCAAFWLRRRRSASRPAEVLALHRAARRARLALRPGETPRELTARAAAAQVAPDLLDAIRAAAAAHERARYGG